MSTIQINTNLTSAVPVVQGASPHHGARTSAGSGPTPTPGAPATTSEAASESAATPEGTPDPAAVRTLASEIQEALNRVTPAPYQVRFRHDEATNGFVIELRDPDGSLIRQYPPEKLLNLRHKLDELSGMVVDEMT